MVEGYLNRLSKECLKTYNKAMEEEFKKAKTYFADEKLKEIHEIKEKAALDQVRKFD